MANHRHTMVRNGNWFACEGCRARVEIVPLVEGRNVTASARVRHAGCGGFSLGELHGLALLWLQGFAAFVEAQHSRRPGQSRRRPLVSAPRFLGAWADLGGVDRSPAG